MGFIQAFKGALTSTFADQWIDFLLPPDNTPPTAALFPAVPKSTNKGRGANKKASENIITNGSNIVVPEGYGLITVEDGAITGFVAEAGGYTWQSGSQQSKSFFSGGGILSSTLQTSWDRFKFGGQPGTQQLAFYVNLKEIPDNRFGTQSPIYWDDSFFGTQVGAVTRGSYTLKIVDPILFVKAIVPVTFISANAPVFDLAQTDNPVSQQLFNEVVASLAASFSRYTNDADKNHRITTIQGDSIGFAQALGAQVEDNYQWTTERGITIVKTALQAIDYDEGTLKLLEDVKAADALSGSRGNAFLQQSVARGFQAAGENGGGDGMAFMAMGANATGGALANLQQPAGGTGGAAAGSAPPAEKTVAEQLRELKAMVDEGLISEDDFEKAKSKLLDS